METQSPSLAPSSSPSPPLCELFSSEAPTTVQESWRWFDDQLAECDRVAIAPRTDERLIFEPDYNARRKLQSLREDCLQKLTALDSLDFGNVEVRSLYAQIAHLNALIGRNMVKTKETTTGHKWLEKAQQILDGLRMGQLYDFKNEKPPSKDLEIVLATRHLKDPDLDPLGIPRLRQGKLDELTRCQIPTSFTDPNRDFTFVHLLLNVYNILGSSWLDLLENTKAEALLQNALRIYQDWLQNSRAGNAVQAEQLFVASQRSSGSFSTDDIMNMFHLEKKMMGDMRDVERQNQMAALQSKLEAKRARKKRSIGGEDVSSSTTANAETVQVNADGSSKSVADTIAAAAAGNASPDSEAPSSELIRQGQLALDGYAQQRLKAEADCIGQGLAMQRQQQALTTWELRTALAMSEYLAHTQYYLGQTYMVQNRDKEAAVCYRKTLQWQLKTKTYDRAQWVSSCLWLGQFYCAENDLPYALHCLKAADLMKPKEASDEIVYQSKRLYAEHGYRLLKLFADIHSLRHQNSINLSDASSLDVLNETVRSKRVELLMKDGRLLVRFLPQSRLSDGNTTSTILTPFVGLPIDDPIMEIPLVETLSDATQLYNQSRTGYESVLEFYDVDGHTEDRMKCLFDLSDLRTVLCQFETSLDRKVALHQERIPYLTELLPVLNPLIFANVVRQLYFELGSLYETIALLRLDQRRREGARQFDGLINAWLKEAISYFEKFLENFQFEFDEIHENHLKKRPEDKKPFKLPAEYVQPYIMGLFHIAQCHTKLLPPDTTAHNANIDAALRRYTQALKDCDRYLTDTETCHGVNRTELEQQKLLCQQMIELLPGAKRKT